MFFYLHIFENPTVKQIATILNRSHFQIYDNKRYLEELQTYNGKLEKEFWELQQKTTEYYNIFELMILIDKLLEEDSNKVLKKLNFSLDK